MKIFESLNEASYGASGNIVTTEYEMMCKKQFKTFVKELEHYSPVGKMRRLLDMYNQIF